MRANIAVIKIKLLSNPKVAIIKLKEINNMNKI